MKWYQLNKDKTVTMLSDGIYPTDSYINDDCKRVGLDNIGDVRISTVFLFFDHSLNFGDPGLSRDPILFESMIFGGEHTDYQRRYHTYDEALQGHNNLVKSIQEDKDPDFYFNNIND